MGVFLWRRANEFEYLFAKPYLDEVLGERRGKRENEKVQKRMKKVLQMQQKRFMIFIKSQMQIIR